jgi:tRNA threonylcarbamoyladenosine biosynthesis protein TsaB
MPRFILAFDTAMSGCSVAVLDTKTGQTAQQSRVMERGQSEILVPMILDVVKEAGCAMADLGLVVTTVGPGGFTGLRIGLSTARSFSLALDIPVAGVRTTDVLLRSAAEKTLDQNELLAVVETKREDFYVQKKDGAPSLASAADLLAVYQDRDATLCGDGIKRLQNELAQLWPARWQVLEDIQLPDPVMLARMGGEDARAGKLRPPDPVYLREADVSQSKRMQRTIAE